MRFARILMLCAMATAALGLLLSLVTVSLAPELHADFVRGHPEFEKQQREAPVFLAVAMGLSHWWMGALLAVMWWFAAPREEPVRTFATMAGMTIGAVALAVVVVALGVYATTGTAVESMRAAHAALYLVTMVCGLTVAMRIRVRPPNPTAGGDAP